MRQGKLPKSWIVENNESQSSDESKEHKNYDPANYMNLQWTRVQVLSNNLSRNIRIYDLQKDMEFDRNLKTIRKEVSHNTGSIIFNPDHYNGENFDFSLDKN